MKRAGIITVHSAYNYGAALQSYATQKEIEKLGVDCEIIDYVTKRADDEKKLFVSFSSVSNCLHNIRNIFTAKSFMKRKKYFEEFKSTYYHLSKKAYNANNISDIEKDVNYDFYITGSDQTFNLNLGGNIEERKPYFLPFVNKGKKISYASSMGEHMSDITETQKEWLSEQFKSYACLSVREKVLADYINEISGINAETVLDPTLVLDQAEWDEISVPTKYDGDDYIFFYTVLSDSWVIDYANKISKQTGLKVIAVHPKNRYEISASFIRADFCGPLEFVSLIKNAKLVITTSFHGTAFSINFNKPFVSLVLGEGNRINLLLSLCGLNNRAVTEADKALDKVDLYNVDFDKTNKYIEKARLNNINFLKKAFDIEE